MSSHLELEIERKVALLPEHLQQRVLTLIDEVLLERAKRGPLGAPHIWEIFERLSQQIPLEEWSKLSKTKNDSRYSFIGIGNSRQHSSSKHAQETSERVAEIVEEE
jgi:hypothetical protein